jgi:hypothetical protein
MNTLTIGQTVIVRGFGAGADVTHTILAIKPLHVSQSGFVAMLSGYPRWLDIAWLSPN